MEFLRGMERLAYEFYPFLKPNTSSFFKAKHITNQRIIAWENKGSQKTEAAEERNGHHGLALATTTARGRHHGQAWCLLAGGAPFSRSGAFWCIFLVSGFFSLHHLIWAYWACFATLFTWLASTCIFLLKLGPNHENLQS